MNKVHFYNERTFTLENEWFQEKEEHSSSARMVLEQVVINNVTLQLF